MFSSLAFMPASNASTVSCTADGCWKASVEPHHTMTRRSQSFSVRKFSMSAMRAMAWSHLLSIFLTRVPSSRLTHFWSNTASMATMPSISAEMEAMSRSSSTPQARAASRAFGEMGSQPPKTMSSSEARGAKSRISSLRPSSRLPRRMWAIWLTEPSGGLPSARALRTPAMKVDETAPMPGVSTPSLPFAGAMSRGSVMD